MDMKNSSMSSKFVAKMSIARQVLLNFMAANPRLVTFLAALGISISLASLGRFTFHEVLAAPPSGGGELTVTPPENMPKDAVLKFPIDKLSTIIPATCANCFENNPIFEVEPDTET
jgi:hypothetical protein